VAGDLTPSAEATGGTASRAGPGRDSLFGNNGNDQLLARRDRGTWDVGLDRIVGVEPRD
jgi:hypothetical protein